MRHTRAVLLLLAVCVSLAAAAAEIPLNAPLPGPAAGIQAEPVVASDGDGYLVLWNDWRFTVEVRATRVTRDGQVLDGTGIPLFSAPYGRYFAVWTGTSYLVTWGFYAAEGVWMLRMDRDGRIIDGPRAVTDRGRPVGVTANGTQVAILYWSETTAGVRARFLTPDAGPVSDIQVTSAAHGPVSVASAGSELVASWMVARGYDEPVRVYATRFTSAGLIDAEPRLLADESWIIHHAIVSNGSSYLLLTGDYATERTEARTVSADLATVGEVTVLPDAIRTSVSSLPGAVWTGSNYAVASQHGGVLAAVALDAQGRAGEPRILESGAVNSPALTPVAATNGQDVLIAWIRSQSDLSTSLDVYGTIVEAPSLQRRAGSLLSISAPRQQWPRVASAGRNLLSVWVEGTKLYARRLRPDGSWLDAEPLAIDPFVLYAPSVVFNGTSYLLTWFEYHAQSRRIITQRIPADGPLRAEPAASFPVLYASDLATASAGDVTLLAWIGSAGVSVVRLDREGALLDTDPVVVGTDDTDDVEIASDGAGRFLVTWTGLEERIGSPPIMVPVAIRGTRVDTNRTPLDSGFTIADSPATHEQPSVIWNGSDWLVLWTHNRDEIRGRRISSAGTLVDGVASDDGVLVATGASSPKAVWDGSRYLVGWTNTATRLQAAWLTRLGDQPVLARDFGDRASYQGTDVSFVPVRPGAVTAVYARFAPEPQYGGVGRAFATVVERANGRRRAVQ